MPTDETLCALAAHCAAHPALQPQDLLKAVHQSVFGCGHLIDDPARARAFLEEEAQSALARSVHLESLGARFCRVDLDILRAQGLSPATLTRLLCLSAVPCGSAVEAERLLSQLSAHTLPFPAGALKEAADRWRAEGFSARRHSPEYHAAYHPAYRVIRTEYARALPLFAAIDRGLARGKEMIVALDGRAGSGKTTLAALLEQVYGECSVFHLDDFFLRPAQRTAARLATPGENVDHERFLAEVLLPLLERREVMLRRFDCATFSLGAPERVPYRPLTVIEGSYSLHPSLRPAYTLTAFLDISGETQAARIRARNTPEAAERFFTRWIPLEEQYFRAFDIPHCCDLRLAAEGALPSI